MTGSSGDHVIALAYNPASQIVSRSGSNDSYAGTAAAAAGRRYSVNGLNQYTAAGPATFAYDSNGNLISSAGPLGTTSYVYDAENRLVSASGAHNASLVYDPLGRLFQLTGSSPGVAQFLYDDDALIGEYDPAWGMPHRYLHGPAKGVDDPIIWYHNSAAGWRQALVSDHQGSIVAVADMYGNPVASNAYDEWGMSPDAQSGSAALSARGRFQYTGQAWIPELGLYYYKARFYSPTLGRFLQTDPIGYDDQVNLYAYVGNDPVNQTDPSGMFRAGSCDPDKRGNVSSGCSGSSVLDAANTHAARSAHGPREYGSGGRTGSNGTPSQRPGIGHNGPPNDPPPTRPWYHYSKLGSVLGAILSVGGDTCKVCDLSLDGILGNPASLDGLTLDQVHVRVGTPDGWVWTRNFQGTQAGKGWVLREWGGQNWSGRQIRWHPGGGRHGAEPYWRVNNGHGQSERIPSGGQW